MSRLGVYTFLKRYLGFVRDPSIYLNVIEGSLKMNAPKSIGIYFLLCVLHYNHTDSCIYVWKQTPKAYIIIRYDWKGSSVNVDTSDYFYSESDQDLTFNQGKYQLYVSKERVVTIRNTGVVMEKRYDISLSVHDCVTQMYKDVKAIALGL